MKNLKGSLILFTAAFFWGTTFVAQVNGSDHLGVFTYNASRSFVGFLFLLIVALLNDNRKKANTGTATAPSKWPVKGGILCGIVLFFAMATQQTGISLYPKQVAAAGRSGFLTAIYVVIVAVIVAIAGKKLQGFVVISVIGTVCGMYLLCLKDGFSGIYIGDLFGLVCAFCFAGHILVVDHYNRADCIKLSCLQFLTAGTLSLLSCLFTEQIVIKDIIAAAPAIFYAGIFSSGVAYTLQMVGQKYTKPAIASIVMSLESVIAVVAGAIVLHEVLSGREILGCTIVFASVILAQIPGFLKKNASE
ncbi:MAG: DMT family transporter [Lachnospiraceae bacterium]|nr:DMT family transporter [Lachnospiraceae bacterium]